MKRRAALVAAISTTLAMSSATVANAGTQQSASRTITMTEFRFSLPPTLGGRVNTMPAGTVRVTFRNTGAFPHNFVVVEALGNPRGGPNAFRSSTLQPGRSQVRTLRLRPGIYLAVCTVRNGGHLAQGMFTRFRVGTFNATDGTWST